MLAASRPISNVQIAKMAVLVAAYDKAGDELPKCDPVFANYLRSVASGRLLPASMHYIKSENVMRLLSRLQPSEQAKVLAAGAIDVKRTPTQTERVTLGNIRVTDVSRVVDEVTGSIKPAAKQVVQSRTPRITSKTVSCSVSVDIYRNLVALASERKTSLEKLLQGAIARELVR